MEINVDKFYEELGVRIKHARINANIKPDALGDILGLTRTSIVNIENGRQKPSIHLLIVIANVFRMNFNELLPSNFCEQMSYKQIVSVQRNDIQTISTIDRDTEQSLNEFITSVK